MSKTIAIVVFPGAELLDFAGPLETLAWTKDSDNGDVFTVGPQREIVTNPSALRITVDYLFDSAPVPDIIVVPGGDGAHNRHAHTDAVVAYIKQAKAGGAVITSVCTGTFLLGWAGLLDGRRCTTHSAYRARLAKEFPAAKVEEATVVAEGPDLVTAANVSSGLDLAIYLLGRYFGPEIAARTASGMNFAARPDEIREYNVTAENAPVL